MSKNMNYMKQVAEMLGLEFGEEFRVTEGAVKHRITESGIQWYCDIKGTWEDDADGTFDRILSGRLTIDRKPWRPKEEDLYYHLNINGKDVVAEQFNEDLFDAAYIAFGNFFKTEKDALAHKDELQERARKLFNGELYVEFKEVE